MRKNRRFLQRQGIFAQRWFPSSKLSYQTARSTRLGRILFRRWRTELSASRALQLRRQKGYAPLLRMRLATTLQAAILDRLARMLLRD